jgi:tyrosyl-tRNA synthetase
MLMAKKMIRPIRGEGEYEQALEEIERYFEDEPKPGTSEADRFDLLALIIEAMNASIGRSIHPIRSTLFVTAWKRVAIPKPISAACSARGSERPTS